jgi:hypothetical protein
MAGHLAALGEEEAWQLAAMARRLAKHSPSGTTAAEGAGISVGRPAIAVRGTKRSNR